MAGDYGADVEKEVRKLKAKACLPEVGLKAEMM